MAFIN